MNLNSKTTLIMNIKLAFLMISLCFIYSSIKCLNKDIDSPLPQALKSESKLNYIFSKKGLGDIVVAYVFWALLNLLHEAGHAITGKLLLKSPIDITLGVAPGTTQKPYFQLGGFKLSGFKPMFAFAQISFLLKNYSHLKKAGIFISGPLMGSISSIASYNFMKRYKDFYITKLVIGLIFFQNTFIETAVGLYKPNSGWDIAVFIRALKESKLME